MNIIFPDTIEAVETTSTTMVYNFQELYSL